MEFIEKIRLKSKKGSYIMEAAIVLPIIIFVVITVVLIIMFFYSQMTERSRLHTELRMAVGQMTERTVYPAHQGNSIDAEIYSDSKGMGGEVYGKKYLVMQHKGVLDKKGTFIVEGRCHAVDGVEYVRYCNMVKGAVMGDEE